MNPSSRPEERVLLLFTRTPLHVGAGASVGAIDQPIQRERHTGFPIIPASSLKGTFADEWNVDLHDDPGADGETRRVRVKRDGTPSPAAWLFGSDEAEHAWAGALQLTEARLLAFPVRSARGSFAWLTCPLILGRAVRDGLLPAAVLPKQPIADNEAIFAAELPGEKSEPSQLGPLALEVPRDGRPCRRVVLEEYAFDWREGEAHASGKAFQDLFEDPVWTEVAHRLVILSDGMMSHFARHACEVAQHVKIDDLTGTAADKALFNQENVPSESLFWCTLRFFPGRGRPFKERTALNAVEAFRKKIPDGRVLQFGGDASTGLGYCSLNLHSAT